MCIQPGSTNVEKDILVKYFKGEQNKRAADLQTKSKVRAEGYQQNIVIASFPEVLMRFNVTVCAAQDELQPECLRVLFSVLQP